MYKANWIWGIASVMLVLLFVSGCIGQEQREVQLLNAPTVHTSSTITPSQPAGTPSPAAIEATPAVHSSTHILPTVEVPLGEPPQDCPPGPTPERGGIGASPLRAYGSFGGEHATMELPPQYSHHTEYGWVQKIGWSMAKTQQEPITIRGTNLQDRTPLWFELLNGSPTKQLLLDPQKPLADWGEDTLAFPSLIYIPKAGCYALEGTWNGGQWSVTFAAGR